MIVGVPLLGFRFGVNGAATALGLAATIAVVMQLVLLRGVLRHPPGEADAEPDASALQVPLP